MVSGAELAALLRAARWSPWSPRYNIAPTQVVPILRLGDDGQREIVPARWGLVPAWAEDPAIGSRMINARAETAGQKPAFRSALKRRRCIVPASGFYEWQKTEGSGTKQPWFIHRVGGGVLAMAGLWERWDRGDEPLESFTILTTSPNALMERLHDRMPVLLEPQEHARWLDAGADADEIASMLDAAPDGALEARRVSTRVNSPRNDDPTLIQGDTPGLFG